MTKKSNLVHIFMHFINLFLFKAKPQDLPYSKNIARAVFLINAFIIYVLVELFETSGLIKHLNQTISISKDYILLSLISNQISLCIVLYYVLSFAKKQARFVQTISNILGIYIVYSVLNLFIVIPLQIDILAFLLYGWRIILSVNIYKEAFSANTFQAFMYFIFTSMMSLFLTIVIIMPAFTLIGIVDKPMPIEAADMVKVK